MTAHTSTLDLLTVEDLAQLFKVRKRKVYDLVRDAGLPHLRIGRSLRFRCEDVRDWLEGTVESGPAGGAAPQAAPAPPPYDWSKRKI